MDIIMEEARKRGMKVWILDDDHFPTGHVGGKVKEAPAELHRVFLGERYVDTIGPAKGASLLVDTLLMCGLRPTSLSPNTRAAKISWFRWSRSAAIQLMEHCSVTVSI
ncbi:hypothetical protein HMSSN036_57990 [Paenibacillus macerans]|nr:hypothetical protein HMSSN036_57990 [Paenibacillus macerans]